MACYDVATNSFFDLTIDRLHLEKGTSSINCVFVLGHTLGGRRLVKDTIVSVRVTATITI